MKILVTGSHGQLGTELQNILEKRLPGITVYTDSDILDITDAKALEAIIQKENPTHIVNCAAYTAVDKAETESNLCYKINTEAVATLATVAARNNIKVLHFSTDYVFDGHSYTPYSESSKTNPLSTYGTSKRKGEMVLLSICPDAVVVRTSWLYSPYGNNFMKTMLRLGSTNKELKVVVDQIGSPTYAADLADAVFSILMSRQWVPGIYHYANEGVCSRYDFAKAILDAGKITDCRVTPIATADFPTDAERPLFSVLDKSLIKRTYGITIPNWHDSLLHCINRYYNNITD
ncbi:MAG: dTDP-4-dehydrorhamnose reductase [Paramuribaculum sp.]|nr:dTDP-4-dehydrorhamnose reductase [Paramuribaculum sp.]